MAKAKTLLAALTLSAAAVMVPATASAQSYNSGAYTSGSDYLDCKRSDKDAQVVGGLVGGLLGAVAGHEIAGRGDTTEGAVIGGLIGAAAGAGVGDDRRNCRKETRARTGYATNTGYRVPTSTTYGGAVITEVHHGGRRHNGRNRGYDRGHDQGRHRGYDRGYDRGYNRGYRDDFGGFRSKRDVRYQIERLKDEDRRLKRRAKYEYRPGIERRRDEIRWEVKRLKRIEDRFERRNDRVRDRRDDRRDYRNDNRHYHGQNVCYSRH